LSLAGRLVLYMHPSSWVSPNGCYKTTASAGIKQSHSGRAVERIWKYNIRSIISVDSHTNTADKCPHFIDQPLQHRRVAGHAQPPQTLAQDRDHHPFLVMLGKFDSKTLEAFEWFCTPTQGKGSRNLPSSLRCRG
jgi:hypothetical protein